MSENNKKDYILVQGLKYYNPKRPPLKEIRGNGLPRTQQVWNRREEYLQWEWNIDSKEGPVWYLDPEPGQLEWYEAEVERINFGDWIIIDGKPIYINKWFYFFLQWHTLQEGFYPQYRDTSLEFFRFFEIIYNEPFTLGVCGIKGRRLGMSSHAASIQLQVCLLEENTLNGIVSKTGVDAQEMYYMERFSLENLPNFLLPDMRTIGEKEMHFATPAQRISKNNKTPNKKRGLNNRVGWLATAENSYDGRKLKTLILDEAAKVEEANITNLFSKVSETLAKGASVVGKVLMFSTVNAMDKGGANFKEIWDDSDHLEDLDELGQTRSRLKRFFIPGYKGVEGYIDQFGNSVVDDPTPEQTEYLKNWVNPETGLLGCPNPNIGSKKYREIRRKSMSKDSEKLAEEIRKYPFTWEETFTSAHNDCFFNTDDLDNQEERIISKMEEQGLNPDKDELGRRGWFRKLPSDKVIWQDDPKGMWYIHEFLPTGEDNKYDFKFGKQYPTNTTYGAAGLDPFAHAKNAAEKGSNAAVVIRKRYTSVNPDESGKPVALFLGRPKRKRDFHLQVLYGLTYYGVQMLGERAPSDWVDFFDEEKMDEYLITTQRKTDGEKVKGISPQDKQAREEHLSEQVESSLHDHDKIWFISLIKDRRAFQFSKRTEYDVCMGDGYALMGLKAPVSKEKKQESKLRVLAKGSVHTHN